MVTVSIAEEGNEIQSLMQTMLAARGMRFSDHIKTGEEDYVFLSPGDVSNGDVMVIHQPLSAPRAGDYITIMNADEKISFYHNHSILVTYGFNPLATVTASSIRTEGEETSFLCCLQRSIVTLKGKILDPQEFTVTMPSVHLDIGPVMAFVALGLVLSIQPKEFQTLCIGENNKTKQTALKNM